MHAPDNFGAGDVWCYTALFVSYTPGGDDDRKSKLFQVHDFGPCVAPWRLNCPHKLQHKQSGRRFGE